MFLSPGPVLLGIAAGLLAWNGAASLATAVWSSHLGNSLYRVGIVRTIKCCAAMVQQQISQSCSHGATQSGLSAGRMCDDWLHWIAGLLSTLFWALSGAGGVVLSWRWASQPKHAAPAKLKAEDADGAVLCTRESVRHWLFCICMWGRSDTGLFCLLVDATRQEAALRLPHCTI